MVGIGGRGLFGISDETAFRLPNRVHARARCEILRRLCTPVQHDDEREWLAAIAAGNVELVGSRPGVVREARV